MDQPKQISLSLDLEQSGEQLTGRIRGGTGPARSFAGWLGLLGTLDALLQEKTTHPTDDPGSAHAAGRPTQTTPTEENR